AKRLARRLTRQFRYGRPDGPLGINIGKSKAVSLEHAAEEYVRSFELLADFADYFTINISSPNTPELRSLQEESRLVHLLRHLKEGNDNAPAKTSKNRIQLRVKISPDLNCPQTDAVIQTI